jgi:hypothetical protein
MRKSRWSGLLKDLPKLALFSFGIALCCLMLVAMMTTFVTKLSHSFDASYARWVFGGAFGISIIGFAISRLRGAAK